jgi:hypothetical protein
MGLCIACFLRDTAGVFGGAPLHMGAVAYIRPEILGLVLGAAAAAVVSREFRPRGGAAFVRRFAIGFAFMMAALVFLGCTVRAWLRLGGGDLNAAVGIAGMVLGIAVGSAFLRGGYTLGRARDLSAAAGWVGPAAAALLLALAAAIGLGRAPSFATVTPANARATPKGAVVAGEKVLKPADSRLIDGAVVAPDGKVVSAAAAVAAAKPMPGGKRAPLLISLLAGLVLGFVAQRSRLCTTGGIRDLFLWRRVDKLLGVLGLFTGALVVNAVLGQFRLGFADQPVAHTDALGNFAAMSVAGLAAVLMGGCPLRQVIMAGEGDVDAGGAVLGMLAGALLAHGLQFTSSPRGVAPGAMAALGVLGVGLLAVGFWNRKGAPAPGGSGSGPAPA